MQLTTSNRRTEIIGWAGPAFLLGLVVVFWLLPFPLLEKLHGICFGICPQRPTHSYALGGTTFPGETFLRENLPGFAILDPATPQQLPICARDSGMYLGFITVWGYLIALGRGRARGLPPWQITLTLILFVGVMGFDGVNALLNDLHQNVPAIPYLYEPQLQLRLGTGLLTGVAFAGILTPVVNMTLWRQNDPRPSIATWRQLVGAVGVVTIVFAINESRLGLFLYPVALTIGASVLILIGLINMVFVLSIFRKECIAETWRDALNPFAVGVFFALIELGLLALMRYAVLGTTVLP